MGKTTNFERRERDFYPTPREPVQVLKPFLSPLGKSFTFAEPCCGAGDLVRHLEEMGGVCKWQTDLPVDVRKIKPLWVRTCDYIITNPPWPHPKMTAGQPTVDIIRACMNLRMSWFLLSADFMHSRYFAPLQDNCRRIVSAGRIKWIEGSKHAALDNAAWYLFSVNHSGGPKFHNMKDGGK